MAKVLLTTIGDEEALGIRSLATALKKNGHTPHLLYLGAFISNMKLWKNEDVGIDKYMIVTDSGDVTAWSNPLDNIDAQSLELYEKEIRDSKPDIICFSGRSFFDSGIGVFFERLRKIAGRDTWIVSGGHGPTFDPGAYLVNGDFVIRGEGEDALVQLANAKDANSIDEARQIPNLCFRNDENQIICNPLQASRTSEDRWPEEPFLYGEATTHIISGQKYENNSHTSSYYTMGGRGCLMSCSYCGGGNWTKIYSACGISVPKRRRRPLESVLSELQRVKQKHDVKFVHFCDEHFAYPREDLLKFFSQYKQDIGVPFFLYFHAAQIAMHPELLDAAVDAGLHQASLGIQTGDEVFALKVYNRKNQNDVILKCASLFAEKDIHCDYQFIQGSPWESREKILRDYEFVAALPYNGQNSRLTFSWFTPHKGAPIMEACRKAGQMRAPVKSFILDSMFLGLARYMPLEQGINIMKIRK